MALYSYSFQDKKRDLSDVLSTIVKDEPRFISNFKHADDARLQKHEWLEDQISGRSVTAAAVDGMVVSKRPASHILKISAAILFPVSKDAAVECRF